MVNLNNMNFLCTLSTSKLEAISKSTESTEDTYLLTQYSIKPNYFIASSKRHFVRENLRSFLRHGTYNLKLRLRSKLLERTAVTIMEIKELVRGC